MTCKRRRTPIYAAAVAMIAGLVVTTAAAAEPEPKSEPESEAWYEGVYAGLGYWSGSLGLDYSNGLQSNSSPITGTSTSKNSLFNESLRITNSGFYVLNPLLMTGNMTLDLQANQDKSGDSQNSTSEQGKGIGYNVDATFLSEMPLTGTVFANRTQSQTLQSFGLSTVGTIQNSGALIHLRQDSLLKDWGYFWVEANLNLQQEHNQYTTTNFGHSAYSDERNRLLNFNASKGFETADLNFSYLINEHSFETFEQQNFRSNTANITYSLDFGPNLNRRLDATLDMAQYSGVVDSTVINNNERVHIDHYQDLSTDYQYNLNRLTAGGISALGQNGTATVSYQVNQNLSTAAGVTATRATLQNGSITTHGFNLSEGYNHRLPGNGTFTLNWSGSQDVSNTALSTSSIDVVDEAHQAPTPLGAGVGFTLNHRFVVEASIVVFNTKGGGRVLTYPGVDYDVVAQSNQITIVPLAGSLLIAQGDPLLVSYNYQVDANLDWATTSSNWNIGVSYGWITASYAHQETKRKPLSQGTSLFLESSLKSAVLIDLRGSLLGMDANANMDLERNEWIANGAAADNPVAVSTAYDDARVGATLSRDLQSNMRIIFGVGATETRYSLPTQYSNSSRSARGSFSWFTAGGWSNTASLDVSNYEGTKTPPETIVQMLAQSRVTLGKLTLNTNLAYGQWLRNNTRATNRSFNVSILRQF